MKAKIIALTSNHLPTGDTPQSVIGILQSLNAKAERGELTGLAVAYVEANGDVFTQIAQGSSDSSRIVSAVMALFWDINKRWHGR